MASRNGTAQILDAPKIEAIDDGWEIDFDGIKVKERTAFANDWKNANERQEDTLLFPWLAKVIKRWPYAGLDPANVDDYGDLGLSQYQEVARRFGEAFRAFLPATKTDAAGGGTSS